MKRAKKFLCTVVACFMTVFVIAGYLPVKTASAKVNVPKVEFASPPVTQYTAGDRIGFNIYAPNYGGRVQYRVVLWNDSQKTYYDLWNENNGYPSRYYTKWQPYGNNIFTLGWVISEPGTYRITVYAKRAGIANSKTALKGYNCDSFMESVAFYVKAKEAVVDEILPLADVTVAQGSTPTLPTKVKAAMSDGLIKELGVTWPTVSTSNPGTQTIQGTVEGTTKKATIKVNVTALAAINVYSVVSVSNYLVNINLRDAIYTTPEVSKFSIKNYNTNINVPIRSVSLSTDKKTISLTTDYLTTNSWYTLTVNNNSYNFIANQGSSISLTAQNRQVNVGATIESIVTKSPSDVTLSFYSNNTNIATVNQTTGYITGIYPGTTTITVYGSKAGYATVSTTFTVTVGGQIYAYAQDMNISVGAVQLPTITKNPSDVTLSFVSSNPSIARVDAYNGYVTGVAPGTATITIYASKTGYTTVSSTFTVTVGGQIYAYADNMNISVGAVQMPTITKYPSDVTLRFVSSNPSIATVDTYNGYVTGVAPGTATITIYASKTGYATVNSTFTVTVGGQIYLDADDMTISVGATKMPTITKNPNDVTLSFISSNSSIARVDPSTGYVTGVASGTATITVYASKTGYSTVNTTFTVTVGGEIYVSAQDINVSVGGQQMPNITKSPSDVTLSFASSNSNIARVDANTGIVTGVAPGTATIFVYASKTGYSTVSTTFNVTVGGQIYIDASDMLTFVGIEQTPDITVSPSDATLTFISSNSSIAAVNPSTGAVTGVGPGTATITVYASKAGYSPVSTTFTVSVFGR